MTMKKIAITLAVIIGILVVAKTVGILVNYTIPTSSNEPTIMTDSHIITTSLKHPSAGQFAAFHPPLPEVPNQKQIYIKRLCGIGGDEIEMKNAVFYLNGKNFDEDLELQFSFIVDDQTYKSINKKYPITDANKVSDNVYQVNITDKIAKEFGVESKKDVQTVPEAGPPVFIEFNTDGVWTRDNFGPITIPAGQTFFMGDNRHYSYDCRFFGFVPEEDIKGVVLGY